MAGILKVPFFADETLLSYLARLATANGADTASQFCRHLGIQFSGIRNGNRAAIAELSIRLGANEHQLIRQSAQFSDDYGVTLHGERFSHLQIAKSVFRSCPKCFERDDLGVERMPGTRRYQRAEWLVRAFRCCPEHECELIETPAYASGADLNRCFGEAAPSKVAPTLSSRHRTPSKADLFIQERLRGTRSRGDLLDHSTMATALNFGLALGVAVALGKDCLMTGLSGEQRTLCLETGLTILEQGESAFVDAIDRIASQPSKSTGRGFQIFGRFVRIIYNTRTLEDFDRFRALAIKRAGEITPLSRAVPLTKLTLLSTRAIARKTGLSHNLVESRLITEGYASESLKSGVNAKEIGLFLDPSRRLINTRQVCETLQIDHNLLAGIEDAGIIRRENPKSPQRDDDSSHSVKTGRPLRSRNGLFIEQDISRLRDDMVRGCKLSYRASMVTLRKFSKSSGENLPTLFRAILEGRLPAAEFGEASDFIDRVFVEPVRQHESEYLTATEAASELDVRSGTLSKLLKHNLIACVRKQTKAQRFATKLITRVDAASFKTRYVTIGQLHNSSGLDRNTIRGRMKKLGITPAFPPAEVLACFIHQRDVDRILADR